MTAACIASQAASARFTTFARPTRQLAVAPQSRRPGRQLAVTRVHAQFRARWTIDVKFGSKADATALLQEWVRDVGAQAGLTPANTGLTTGSVGAPESTLELEVQFGSLGALEDFWSSIPAAAHKAWGQRMEKYVVHGSPAWTIYRVLPAFPEDGMAAAGSAAPGRPLAALPSSSGGTVRVDYSSSRGGNGGSGSGGSGGLLMPTEEELTRLGGDAAGAPSVERETPSGLSVVSGDEEAQVVLDWKGDPMTINPGDKMPFKFL